MKVFLFNGIDGNDMLELIDNVVKKDLEVGYVIMGSVGGMTVEYFDTKLEEGCQGAEAAAKLISLRAEELRKAKSESDSTKAG